VYTIVFGITSRLYIIHVPGIIFWPARVQNGHFFLLSNALFIIEIIAHIPLKMRGIFLAKGLI